MQQLCTAEQLRHDTAAICVLKMPYFPNQPASQLS